MAGELYKVVVQFEFVTQEPAPNIEDTGMTLDHYVCQHKGHGSHVMTSTCEPVADRDLLETGQTFHLDPDLVAELLLARLGGD